MNALVIIDMQRCFRAACDHRVISGVVLEVEQAKRQQLPILVVEFDDDFYEATVPKVWDAIGDYPLTASCYKDSVNGCREVQADLFTEFGIEPPSALRLCGVNTSQCVGETAEGLAQMGFQVVVAENACGDQNDCHQEQISYWRQGRGRWKVKVA